MNWSSAADFLAMGGYGLYVWGSFGFTALLVAGEVLALRARRSALNSSAAQEADADTQHDLAGVAHEA